MQRHHLLPRQLLSQGCFSAFLEVLGTDRIGFDDFRLNGLLLPARDGVAARLRLPLHRGPHATYNALVAMRVGRIERDWSARRLRWPASARQDAIMRLRLLQGALRRRLLAPDRPQVRLNRHQTIVAGVDFTELDALADVLWADAGATT